MFLNNPNKTLSNVIQDKLFWWWLTCKIRIRQIFGRNP